MNAAAAAQINVHSSPLLRGTLAVAVRQALKAITVAQTGTNTS
jgi:hypothetical protein